MDRIENDSVSDDDDAFDESLLDTTVLPSKCTKNDVILGRGKAINNWPGNVQFRQLAMKYRDEYHQANRYQKVEIALLVMDEIVAMGGRFVRVEDGSMIKMPTNKSDNDFECYEVDEARAIEKTCQTLRDRHYIKHKIIPRKVVPTSSDRNIETTEAQQNESIMAATTSCGAPHAKVTNETGYTNSQSKTNRRHRPYPHQNTCSSIHWTTDDMLQRLQIFQSMYHHTCVPPDWKNDVILADWCTVQRHLYRQFQSKYQTHDHCDEYDQSQIKLFDTLQTMNFCWDYDEWHWNHWWDQLVTAGDEIDLDDAVRDWLRQQQRHYRNGNMSKTRSEKLRAEGYLPSYA